MHAWLQPRLLLPMLCCSLAECSSREECSTLACGPNLAAAGSCRSVWQSCWGL